MLFKIKGMHWSCNFKCFYFFCSLLWVFVCVCVCLFHREDAVFFPMLLLPHQDISVSILNSAFPPVAKPLIVLVEIG